MKDSDSLKQIVKDKYTGIAMAPKQGSCECCVSGALQKNDYLSIVEETGIFSITVTGEKPASL